VDPESFRTFLEKSKIVAVPRGRDGTQGSQYHVVEMGLKVQNTTC